MFQHSIESFGVFQKHILSSPDGAHRLAFVPGHGACLLELQLHGVPVLDGYDTPEAMIENKYGKNIVLYPFPNRLKGGTYQWQGKTYQFPINNAATGNAIHGFGRDRPMQIARTDINAEGASITCVRHEAGDEAAYPFIFSFFITFTLHADGLFEMEMKIRNHSEMPIPAGMGWHPYFSLADSVDEMSLQLPPCRGVEIDETMIPTGRLLPEERFDEIRLIGEQVIDNCFALTGDEPVAEVLLSGPKGRLRYRQEAGPGKFLFVQVFTPPHRRSIAVEPMTCNIDAFNNGMGLWSLEPGEEAVAAVRVRWEPA